MEPENENATETAHTEQNQTAGAEASAGADQQENATEQAGEELLLAIGEEPAAPADADDEEHIDVDGKKVPAPAWLRKTRDENRELNKRVKELEAQTKAAQTASEQPKPIIVGDKPTLAGCSYDEDRFAAELEAWKDRKTEADQQERQLRDAKEKQEREWAELQTAYTTEHASLKAKMKDADVAETTALGALSTLQQSIILQGTKQPALLIIALGKSPEKLKELSAIKDPTRFAVAVGRIESEVRTKMHKPTARVESKVVGNSSTTATVDAELERLRTEANKTGDRTKVAAYMQKQRAAASQKK